MAPLFSIITVTFNAKDTIMRTLQSVDKQSCKLYEHLVIDGESTDGTLDIAYNFPSDKLTVYSSSDRGLYDAMNKGMKRAAGDYFIFLNAGDTFHSADTLQRMADAIMAHDYPGIVYGQTDIVDNDGRYLGPRHLLAPEVLTFESFADGMLVCHQAMAVYRKIAPQYDLKYKYSGDYDWVVKCLKKSKRNAFIPDTLIDFLSEGMTTSHHFDSLKERFRIMCRHYGTLPTVARHAKFLVRYLSRRKHASNKQ